MASLDDIRATRLAKLKLLQEKSVNPYPISTAPSVDLATAEKDFARLVKKKSITLAGRVMAASDQGIAVRGAVVDPAGVQVRRLRLPRGARHRALKTVPEGARYVW